MRKTIGKRLYDLWERGIKATGSYVEGLFYIEESLTFAELDDLKPFAEWCDADRPNRCFGWGNYEARYAQFLQGGEQ